MAADEYLSVEEIRDRIDDLKGRETLFVEGCPEEGLPRELGTLRSVTTLWVRGRYKSFHPEALKLGTKKVLVRNFPKAEDVPPLANLHLEHGFGNWRFFNNKPYNVEGPQWFKPMQLLQRLGDDGLGDLNRRKELFTLAYAVSGLGELLPFYREWLVDLPEVATTRELDLLNASKSLTREPALVYLEKHWPRPKVALAGAKVCLLGKPRYYPKAELNSRLDTLGAEVVRDAKKATVALLMESPKEKLQQALDADLPIFLERHLRDQVEARAPTLVQAETPAAQNLAQMLESDEPGQAMVALQLLGSGKLPAELLEPLLLAVMFNKDAKTRKEAKALLLKKAPAPYVEAFEQDRTAYLRIEDGGKFLAKLRALTDKLVGADGFDAARFALTIGKLRLRRGSYHHDVTPAVLAWPENAEAYFELIEDDSMLQVFLDSLDGVRGFERMKKLDHIRFTGKALGDAGPHIAKVKTIEQVRLSCKTGDLAWLLELPKLRTLQLRRSVSREGMASIAQCQGLTSIQIEMHSTRDEDLEAFQKMSTLESLTLGRKKLSDEAVEAFRAARPDVSLELWDQ